LFSYKFNSKKDQQIAKHTFGPLSRMIIQISHTKGLLIVLAFLWKHSSWKGLAEQVYWESHLRLCHIRNSNIWYISFWTYRCFWSWYNHNRPNPQKLETLRLCLHNKTIQSSKTSFHAWWRSKNCHSFEAIFIKAMVNLITLNYALFYLMELKTP